MVLWRSSFFLCPGISSKFWMTSAEVVNCFWALRWRSPSISSRIRCTALASPASASQPQRPQTLSRQCRCFSNVHPCGKPKYPLRMPCQLDIAPQSVHSHELVIARTQSFYLRHVKDGFEESAWAELRLLPKVGSLSCRHGKAPSQTGARQTNSEGRSCCSC